MRRNDSFSQRPFRIAPPGRAARRARAASVPQGRHRARERNIGRATATTFAHAGANLVVSGRRPEAGEVLAAELRGHGGEVEFIAADVRHESEVQHLVDATVERLGQLDVVVNNADADGDMVLFAGVTPEGYAAVFDTNVLGTLLGSSTRFG